MVQCAMHPAVQQGKAAKDQTEITVSETHQSIYRLFRQTSLCGKQIPEGNTVHASTCALT